MLELNNAGIFDVDQALDVLHNGGPEALAVYFVYESAKNQKELTISSIVEATHFSVVEVENACYRLGLVMLGIKIESALSRA